MSLVINRAVAGRSDSATNREELSVVNTGGAAGIAHFVVYGFNGVSNPSYQISFTQTRGCTVDAPAIPPVLTISTLDNASAVETVAATDKDAITRPNSTTVAPTTTATPHVTTTLVKASSTTRQAACVNDRLCRCEPGSVPVVDTDSQGCETCRCEAVSGSERLQENGPVSSSATTSASAAGVGVAAGVAAFCVLAAIAVMFVLHYKKQGRRKDAANIPFEMDWL
jgi:hypothetical protein